MILSMRILLLIITVGIWGMFIEENQDWFALASLVIGFMIDSIIKEPSKY